MYGSRRQIGTKPSDVASEPHYSHWPNGSQCVHSRRLVRGCRTILYDSLVGTVEESYLLQLSVVLYTFGSRSDDLVPPDGPYSRSGSGTHSHYWPSRQHRGTIGASDRLMWSGHNTVGKATKEQVLCILSSEWWNEYTEYSERNFFAEQIFENVGFALLVLCCLQYFVARAARGHDRSVQCMLVRLCAQ